MQATASRALLRQSRFLIRKPAVRTASTTSEAAAKTKDAASSATQKASEEMSKVASAAGPAISGAMQGVGGALRKVGGRTGRLISFFDSLIPPTIYYSKVGIELGKIVFNAQKMAPPSIAQFQGYWQPIINSLRQPATLTSKTSSLFSQQNITRVLSFDRRQWAVIGVTTAEVIGFFSVGEILGRMKLVGYRGETAHGH